MVCIMGLMFGCATRYVCDDGTTSTSPEKCQTNNLTESTNTQQTNPTNTQQTKPTNTQQTDPTNTQQTDPTTTPKNDDPIIKLENKPQILPQPEQKEEIKEKTMTAKAVELLEKHEKIESYYYYLDSGTSQGKEIWVKGDLIKTKRASSSYTPAERVDAVFIDRSKQTTTGYCYLAETDSDCLDERRGKTFDLNFKEENIVTPLDLIKSIKYAEIISEEMLEGRTLKLIQTDDNKKFWLDSFSGIVMKYQKIKPLEVGEEVLEEHTYTEVAINTLTTDDVNIPVEE